jgi:hypothetical protein
LLVFVTAVVVSPAGTIARAVCPRSWRSMAVFVAIRRVALDRWGRWGACVLGKLGQGGGNIHQ